MDAPIPSLRVVFTDDEIEEVGRATETILRCGWLTLGRYTTEFEVAFAHFLGCRYAIAVNSGTSALEIIFRAIGIEGKRVLVPANTNFATAAAALHAGGTVSFVDGGLFLDIDDLQAKLSADVAAVVVVHIGGFVTPEMAEIVHVCRSRGVFLVEDAAHAHGAKFAGCPAGRLADAGAFSFFPTKVMTTGEGGIITTDDAGVNGAARALRDQGKDFTRDIHVLLGNSWRMSEFAAALGAVQLCRLDAIVADRRRALSLYAAAFQGNEQLEFVTAPPNTDCSGYKAIAILRDGSQKARLRTTLQQEQIAMGRGVYDVPLHKQPVFAHLAAGQRFPLAEAFSERHICLPLWRGITSDVILRVARSTKSVCS